MANLSRVLNDIQKRNIRMFKNILLGMTIGINTEKFGFREGARKIYEASINSQIDDLEAKLGIDGENTVTLYYKMYHTHHIAAVIRYVDGVW